MLAETIQDYSEQDLVSLIAQSFLQAKFRAAEIICEELLTRPDCEPQALTLLAQAAYLMGKDDIAEGYIARTVDLLNEKLARYPNNSNTHQSLATIFLCDDREDEATSHLRQADVSLVPYSGPQGEFFDKFQSGIARRIPFFLIVSPPYSGSEGLAKFLADGLIVAQGPVSVSVFPNSAFLPSCLAAAAQGGIATAADVNPTQFNIEMMNLFGLRKLVLALRDPRAVTASWADALLSEPKLRVNTSLNRRTYPPAKVLRQGRSAVLDWCIETFLPLVCDYTQSWRVAEADMQDQLDIHWVKVEDVGGDPLGKIHKILDHFGVERGEFDAAKAKIPQPVGAKDIDPWRSAYTPEQLQRANDLMPDELFKAFGWER